MSLKTKEKKVLIVKINRLGDTIAFLPALDAIRRGWPEAHMTLLTTEIGREIAEGTGLVNDIWVSSINEVNRFAGFFKWLSEIRKNKFDCAIASSDSSSFVALLLFMSGIPARIGFTNPKLSFLYTYEIPFSEKTTHAELNFSIAGHLGISTDYSKIEMPIPGRDKNDTLNLLKANGVDESDRFIVIHPGSRRLSRRWPVRRFKELISFILKEYPVKVICVDGKEERKLVPLAADNSGRLIDLRGKTGVKQLICLISMAELFIGHSSGPLQIAYIFGKSSISLWGASSPVIWGPSWNKKRHVCVIPDLDCCGCEQPDCPKKTLDCMGLITTDMVEKEVFKMLLTRSLA